MTDLLPITLEDQIAEVEREIAMRRRLYPQWMQDAGRNKRMQMERQLTVMLQVLETLRRLKDNLGEEGKT